MVLKRSWQVGVCLGAALLLAGMAQAAEEGYWKQQGDVEYFDKSLPPHGPARYTDQGWTIVVSDLQIGKVRFTHTAQDNIAVVEYTWTRPPAVMIPDQVVPVTGRIQVLKTPNPGWPSGGLFACQISASNGVEVVNLFAGLNIRLVGKAGEHLDITNTKNTIGKGTKGQKVYLRFSPSRLQVGWPYVWMEGTPPASVPPPPLPPIGTASPEPAPVSPVSPVPPVAEPATVSRMTLQAAKRKAKAGETVTVPVWLLKGAGLIDMNFSLEYDAAVVQVVGSVVKGNLLEGADFEANPGKPGVVQVGLVPKTGGVAASDGTIAQVAFKAVGQAGSRTTLRLVPRKASLAGGAPANPATIDGEVQIVDDAGLVPGDINGDGKVGMDDVMLALKISVELLPHNARADVDKDGQVTAADARVIRDRVLGIKG